eukprot:gene4581-5718_t
MEFVYDEHLHSMLNSDLDFNSDNINSSSIILNHHNHNNNDIQQQEEEDENNNISTLQTLSYVSSLFNYLIDDFQLWKPRCKLLNLNSNSSNYRDYASDNNSNNNIDFKSFEETTYFRSSTQQQEVVLLKNRVVRFYTDEIEPYSQDRKCWKRLYRELGLVTLYNNYDLISKAIERSSCDSEDQDIGNTLDTNRSFWSSSGSPDVDSSEFLTYQFEQPSLVSAVRIHLYKAFYQSSMPTYAPQRIKISVGFSKNLEEMHYTSDEFFVEVTDQPQTFYLEPRLVVGNFIRIDLLGRVQKQSNDNLYYTVLRFVCVNGIPIGSLEDNKQELATSILKFASKFTNIKELLPPNNNDINNNNNIEIPKILQQLKYQMVPKHDKVRIYNQNLYQIFQYLSNGEFIKAAQLVVKFNMRSTEMFQLFLNNPNNNAISSYYIELTKSQEEFTQFETMYLTREAMLSENNIIFSRLKLSNKLYPCEELGEFLLDIGYYVVAAEIFATSLIFDKVILCMFLSNFTNQAINIIDNLSQSSPLDFYYILNLFKQYSTRISYHLAVLLIDHFDDQYINSELVHSVFPNIDPQIQDLHEISRELHRLIPNEPPIPTTIRQMETIENPRLSAFFAYFNLQEKHSSTQQSSTNLNYDDEIFNDFDELEDENAYDRDL